MARLVGRSKASVKKDGRPKQSVLTDRERDVAQHLVVGQTNIQIGSFLSISPETVKVHVRSMLRKFSCDNRRELAKDPAFLRTIR